MTFTNIAQNQDQAIQAFQKFGADEQLALLWFIYDELRGAITPKGGPDTSGFDIAKGIVDRIQQCSREEQLQAQRDALTGNQGSQFAQAYNSFNSSTRLAFWYLLAQGMDSGEIVQVPGDYQLPGEAQNFLEAVRQLDFNDKITLMRNIVSSTGGSQKPGAVAQ